MTLSVKILGGIELSPNEYFGNIFIRVRIIDLLEPFVSILERIFLGETEHDNETIRILDLIVGHIH